MAPRAKVKGQPQLLNVDRVPGQPKRRKKITLVFDEQKRREFLGGFHKRKLQRQKKAQEDLQKQLKEERKRIKQDARERYKKLVSSRDIPELQQLLSQHEYETEGHTVSILEVNVEDLDEANTLIGENKGNRDAEDTEKEEQSEEEGASSDEIEGMSLNKSTENRSKKPKGESQQIETKKDLKRVMKKAALKQVKKSKAFQQKQKIERQKNKKESMKKLRRKEKFKAKLKKKQHR